MTTSSLHSVRFPNEPQEYRDRRDALLLAEQELRDGAEAVAALRRQLPLGGEVPEDYVFDEGSADLRQEEAIRKTRLSELFAPERGDSLLLYNFMYGPEMASACSSCTSILDSLDGSAPHVLDRTNLAIVARNPIAKIRAFARERGWRNLRLLSSEGNTFNRDYHGETSDGNQMPLMHVFVRRRGKVYHSWASELLFVPPRPGQDGRHVDSFWPLWNLFDLLPEGRGATWHPRLNYGERVAIGRKS